MATPAQTRAAVIADVQAALQAFIAANGADLAANGSPPSTWVPQLRAVMKARAIDQWPQKPNDATMESDLREQVVLGLVALYNIYRASNR